MITCYFLISNSHHGKLLDKELRENLKLRDLTLYNHQIISVLQYSEICHFICMIHNRSISLRQLKHFCQKLKLTRRYHVQNDLNKDIITNELSTSHSCLGYRQSSEFINIKYNLTVSKEEVRKCLKLIDPEGGRKRWRKVKKRRIYKIDGPGDVFHMDGNDKLKRWGFDIHGCIDGFSRKSLWLRVATKDSHPIDIANYYLEFISRRKFCPNVLRMDRLNEVIFVRIYKFFSQETQKVSHMPNL